MNYFKTRHVFTNDEAIAKYLSRFSNSKYLFRGDEGERETFRKAFRLQYQQQESVFGIKHLVKPNLISKWRSRGNSGRCCVEMIFLFKTEARLWLDPAPLRDIFKNATKSFKKKNPTNSYSTREQTLPPAGDFSNLLPQIRRNGGLGLSEKKTTLPGVPSFTESESRDSRRGSQRVPVHVDRADCRLAVNGAGGEDMIAGPAVFMASMRRPETPIKGANKGSGRTEMEPSAALFFFFFFLLTFNWGHLHRGSGGSASPENQTASWERSHAGYSSLALRGRWAQTRRDLFRVGWAAPFTEANPSFPGKKKRKKKVNVNCEIISCTGEAAMRCVWIWNIRRSRKQLVLPHGQIVWLEEKHGGFVSRPGAADEKTSGPFLSFKRRHVQTRDISKQQALKKKTSIH